MSQRRIRWKVGEIKGAALAYGKFAIVCYQHPKFNRGRCYRLVKTRCWLSLHSPCRQKMGGGCKSREAPKKHIIWGNILIGEWMTLELVQGGLWSQKMDSIQVGKKHKAVRVCGCKTDVVPCCTVRFRTYPFQRTAISGNSFHFLKSCCVGFNGWNAHPQANNTW